MRENERLFRDLYEEAPVAYWYITQEGKIDRANRAMAEMFGRPREFFVGRTLHDLYANTPRGIPAALEVRRRIFAGEEVRGEELEARRADGSSFWIRVSVSPEFDAAGRAVGGRIMAIDLSAEKRAEQAVRVSEYLAQEIRAAHNVDEIVGRSPVLMGVLEKVRLVAETDTSVLILGETGTGKELIARALHSASRRKNRPLIKVNCAALPSGLIESELFGHEKGAFTGASERRVGRFELADGGTIFLDEIGEVPPDVQVKLLRVLQEREIERVGGNKTIGVDVRVVAATNRDLKGAVAAGKFRQDLFYRLNVFPIDLPPLRERPEDIRLLVHYFVGRYADQDRPTHLARAGEAPRASARLRVARQRPRARERHRARSDSVQGTRARSDLRAAGVNPAARGAYRAPVTRRAHRAESFRPEAQTRRARPYSHHPQEKRLAYRGTDRGGAPSRPQPEHPAKSHEEARDRAQPRSAFVVPRHVAGHICEIPRRISN